MKLKIAISLDSQGKVSLIWDREPLDWFDIKGKKNIRLYKNNLNERVENSQQLKMSRNQIGIEDALLVWLVIFGWKVFILLKAH